MIFHCFKAPLEIFNNSRINRLNLVWVRFADWNSDIDLSTLSSWAVFEVVARSKDRAWSE